MKSSHKLLFLTSSFSVGLMAPVLSLVLLSHGATLETLSLCIGTYAMMVVILEVPSGILADIFGRKPVFLISCLFLVLNFFLIFISDNILILVAACAFQGIGRALSSGTIETLEIESYMKDQGEDKLSIAFNHRYHYTMHDFHFCFCFYKRGKGNSRKYYIYYSFKNAYKKYSDCFKTFQNSLDYSYDVSSAWLWAVHD